jgi:hypothetical protein
MPLLKKERYIPKPVQTQPNMVQELARSEEARLKEAQLAEWAIQGARAAMNPAGKSFEESIILRLDQVEKRLAAANL